MGLPAKELTLLGSGGSNPLISAIQSRACALGIFLVSVNGLDSRSHCNDGGYSGLMLPVYAKASVMTAEGYASWVHFRYVSPNPAVAFRRCLFRSDT